ncbi:citramalate synthase [Patescibacteria group bacterium]|nr:citramalate synthase [Patescibacteria group bacterium]MBU4512696.1 citramalate synthase [Patescibacteria group bacterium]MCG2693598.1 citramalate synthase [Candidatus Parcubacteria bacterium]
MVTIFDTTLRDGSQAEGISFSVEDKLAIAKRLDDLGVHYIEGGWPNPTNPKDLEFFVRVKELGLKNAKATAFGSTRRAKNTPEKDPILQTLLKAKTQTIALFGKSWDLHVWEVLRLKGPEGLETNLHMIRDSVAFLRSAGREVIYDAEHFFDGYKANPVYALRTLEAALKGGASILVLCDTNGGCLPGEIRPIIADVFKHFGDTPIGIHTHNDSGCAEANIFEAVRLGVCHVQGTINGYGERCGNANLCTVIPTLKLKMGIDCISREGLEDLTELSHFVSEIANVAPDHRQPYVGASAFAHKGGAHADGVVKNSRSFEHIEPELVGNERRFLASDQAGTALVAKYLEQFGYVVDKKDERVVSLLTELKQREAHGYAYEAADGSFELLARRVMGDYTQPFKTIAFRAEVGQYENDQLSSEAIVEVSVDGRQEHTVAKGDGPIHALDNALRKALEKFYPQLKEVYLRDYKVRVLSNSNDDGTAATVRVLIESSDGKRVWSTVGASENIIEASWEALVDSFSYKLLKDRPPAQAV